MRHTITNSKLVLNLISLITVFIFEIYPFVRYSTGSIPGQYSGGGWSAMSDQLITWLLAWIVGWIVAMAFFAAIRQWMNLPKLPNSYVILQSLTINMLLGLLLPLLGTLIIVGIGIQ